MIKYKVYELIFTKLWYKLVTIKFSNLIKCKIFINLKILDFKSYSHIFYTKVELPTLL